MNVDQLRDHMANPISAGGHGLSFSHREDILLKTFHDRDHEANADFLTHGH